MGCLLFSKSEDPREAGPMQPSAVISSAYEQESACLDQAIRGLMIFELLLLKWPCFLVVDSSRRLATACGRDGVRAAHAWMKPQANEGEAELGCVVCDADVGAHGEAQARLTPAGVT